MTHDLNASHLPLDSILVIAANALVAQSTYDTVSLQSANEPKVNDKPPQLNAYYCLLAHQEMEDGSNGWNFVKL